MAQTLVCRPSDRLVHNARQHLADGLLARWVTKVGYQFGQRLEYESAIQHAWVRDLECFAVNHGFAVQEDVNVDQARAFVDGPRAAHLPLDLLRTGQKLAR